MEIKINIEKKHFYILAVLCVLILGVAAFADPIIYHTISEIFTASNGVSLDANANGKIDSLATDGNIIAGGVICDVYNNCLNDSDEGQTANIGNFVGDADILGTLSVGQYANLGSDKYGNWVHVNLGDTDTCTGHNAVDAYPCAINENTASCTDIKRLEGEDLKRTVSCVIEKIGLQVGQGKVTINDLNFSLNRANVCVNGDCRSDFMPRCKTVYARNTSDDSWYGGRNLSVPSFCKDGNVCLVILKYYSGGTFSYSRSAIYSQFSNNKWFAFGNNINEDNAVNGDTGSSNIQYISYIYLRDDWQSGSYDEVLPYTWTLIDNSNPEAGEVIACPMALAPSSS